MKNCILPDFPKDDTLKRIEIKYPNDKLTKGFLFNNRSNELFELIKFKEKFRSWFINDYVYQDGSLFLVTKVDPIFVFLNFLNSEETKFNDVYHIVNENEILFKCLTKNKEINLEVIADIKKIDDDIYVKYNSAKVIKFLKYKISKLNESLKLNSVQVSDNFVKVSNFTAKNEIKESDYTKYSINLLSDYIPKNLVDKLYEVFQIKEEEIKEDNDTKQERKRKLGSDEPIDDYSKLIPNDSSLNKKQKVLTRTEKQLSKVDKSGMKNITDFFKKKSSW